MMSWMIPPNKATNLIWPLLLATKISKVVRIGMAIIIFSCIGVILSIQ